ncbi:MAG: hypothetical protein R2940_03430 [Syntrophotaleaceae bacterium]
MHIPRELTEFFGSFFSPKNASAPNRNSAKTDETLSKRLSSAKVDTSGSTYDRVTFSNDAVAAAGALSFPTLPRQDLPPVLMPAPNPPAEGEPALTRELAMAPVQSVAPVADGEQAPPQREPARAEDRETPETRRLVRKAYGFPQSAENVQTLQSENRIRIRA